MDKGVKQNTIRKTVLQVCSPCLPPTRSVPALWPQPSPPSLAIPFPHQVTCSLPIIYALMGFLMHGPLLPWTFVFFQLCFNCKVKAVFPHSVGVEGTGDTPYRYPPRSLKSYPSLAAGWPWLGWSVCTGAWRWSCLPCAYAETVFGICQTQWGQFSAWNDISPRALQLHQRPGASAVKPNRIMLQLSWLDVAAFFPSPWLHMLGIKHYIVFHLCSRMYLYIRNLILNVFTSCQWSFADNCSRPVSSHIQGVMKRWNSAWYIVGI